MADEREQILAVAWFTPGIGNQRPSLADTRDIGVVLVYYTDSISSAGVGYAKALIGFSWGFGERLDAREIARWGAKFPAAAARAIWPELTNDLRFKDEIEAGT